MFSWSPRANVFRISSGKRFPRHLGPNAFLVTSGERFPRHLGRTFSSSPRANVFLVTSGERFPRHLGRTFSSSPPGGGRGRAPSAIRWGLASDPRRGSNGAPVERRP